MTLSSAFARLQQQLLQAIMALGVVKDEAFVAACEEVGEHVDRTTVVKQRAGTRPMTLGQFLVLLGTVADPAAVLDLLARPHGLHVVPEGDLDTDERCLRERALELGEQSGRVIGAVRTALDDGEVDADELAAIHDTARRLRRQAAELEQLTKPGRRA